MITSEEGESVKKQQEQQTAHEKTKNVYRLAPQSPSGNMFWELIVCCLNCTSWQWYWLYLAREEAVALGNELFKHHFFHHVTFDHDFKDEKLFYRLLGDGYSRALNAQLSYACIPRPGKFWSVDEPMFTHINEYVATEVALDLRKYILEIYDDFLSADGLVCYVIGGEPDQPQAWAATLASWYC